MNRITKDTLCMVIQDFEVQYLETPLNARGHLVYNKGVFSGGNQYWLIAPDYQSFISVPGNIKVVAIDPFHLTTSLKSAYRRSKTFGRLNPRLEK